jgi:isoleucyl-tRNA synthetase
MLTANELLTKYNDILTEEINVKETGLFVSDTPIVKIFKPLGNQLSAKFGKDTGQIIANGKQGNVREIETGIEVFDLNGNTRQLTEDDYEIMYEGLDGDDVAIEGNTIVKLDLELTKELKREGIAREISRFLNQMRKDANFPVDARVTMTYTAENAELAELTQEFAEFFKEEALLVSLEVGNPTGDIVATFESDGKSMTIALKI